MSNINQPSSDAIQRMQKTVRTVERMPQDHTGTPRQAHQSRQGFWARVNSGLTTHPAGVQSAYDWEKVVPLPNGRFATDPEGIKGTSAHNANRVAVPPHTIVYLTFVGFMDEQGQEVPQYIFSYTSSDQVHSGMGPHDHRDNFNGGFAFAVYHPGTALPQMPWAL